jgi:hypothetical protein
VTDENYCSQLDRLWWMWQHEGHDSNSLYYKDWQGGAGESGVLANEITLGSLAPAVTVEDILDTQSGLLCYKY